jgi:hypothetical protein
VKRVLLIVLVVVFASATLALAAWKVADIASEKSDTASGSEPATTPADEGGSVSSGAESSGEVTAAGDSGAAAEAAAAAAGLPSGEDFSPTTSEQRYVTETQRHQNFFVALAGGTVKRLDAVATDYQPAGDPNTSYMYFTISTTDGARHEGTMVLKYESGLWRIAAVRQLAGDLGGGTEFVVPASFEDDLARELVELQDFLTKVAQGRLDYLVVDNVSRPSDNETVLTGRVVGLGGRIQNARMTLRKDYGIWHLTNIESL